jgi:hypothetical protein
VRNGEQRPRVRKKDETAAGRKKKKTWEREVWPAAAVRKREEK